MARPQKQTVDYFPHDAKASEGDTLTILQSRFGNDGYAFWFKLLEKVSSSENHVIDCRNPVKWQLLLAKTSVSEEQGSAIMDLLCELEAIDAQLWHECKIVWCQNLVNNIADVYKGRNRPVPERPVSTTNNLVSGKKIPVSSAVNPQSKVKETKLKESILPEFLEEETWNAYLEMRKKKRATPTEHAKVLLIKKLEEFRDAGDDPNEVLKRSIMNGWSGIFPLDKKGGQDGAHRKSSRQLPTHYRTPEQIFGEENGA